MGSTIDLEKASQAIILAFSEGSKVLDLDKSKAMLNQNVKASDELINNNVKLQINMLQPLLHIRQDQVMLF